MESLKQELDILYLRLLKQHRQEIIDAICDEFEFDKDDLTEFLKEKFAEKDRSPSPIRKLFSPIPAKSPEKPKAKAVVPKEEVVEEQRLSPTQIAKATVPVLKGYCKTRNLPQGGKKDDLINRLINHIHGNVEDTSSGGSSAKSSPGKSKKKKGASILEKMKASVPANIQVKRNKYGNYGHEETGLIFDKFDKKVIGRQKIIMRGNNEEACIIPLNAEDIDLCNQYKFDYAMPENLSSTTAKVKVDEIDSDAEDPEAVDPEAVDPEAVDDGSDGLSEFYESD